MLRRDDDAVYVIDWAAVPRLRRTKHKIPHGFHECATVTRIPDRRTHLNPCHAPVRPNPEPDLVLPFLSGRCPRGNIGYQERCGPEISLAPPPVPGPASAPVPVQCPCRCRPGTRTLSWSSDCPVAGADRSGSCDGEGRRWKLELHGFGDRRARVGTVTAGAWGLVSARAEDGVGSANQLTAGRPPPPPPPRGPVPPPPPPSNSAAPRHNRRMAIARCARNERAAAGPSRRWGRGSA